jgi:hypothetical protein
VDQLQSWFIPKWKKTGPDQTSKHYPGMLLCVEAMLDAMFDQYIQHNSMSFSVSFRVELNLLMLKYVKFESPCTHKVYPHIVPISYPAYNSAKG